MDFDAEQIIADTWGRVAQNSVLNTPDERLDVTFTVAEVSPGEVVILTQSGETRIPIARGVFVEAIRFLHEHGHDQGNPCDIRARQDSTAGPFCRAIRIPNGNQTMISSYVVPMLAQMGLVGVGRTRPNRVWLL